MKRMTTGVSQLLYVPCCEPAVPHRVQASMCALTACAAAPVAAASIAAARMMRIDGPPLQRVDFGAVSRGCGAM
jgi:hypothetical protein